MKNSFRLNNRERPPVGSFAIVALIIVALFGFDILSGGLVRSYARTLGSLTWSAVASGIESVDSSGILASRQTLIRENNALKEELALQSEKSARIQSLENENTLLRELAQLAEGQPRGIAAHVVSSFQASPYGTFLIGSGRNAGVSKGSLVLTPGGFLLGIVSDVDAETASVQALLSPGATIDLVVNDVAFTAVGYGGGNARGEMPRTALVAIGDAVLSPQHGSRVIGIIGAIESASSSASQKVFMRTPANLATLRYVFVIPHEQ